MAPRETRSDLAWLGAVRAADHFAQVLRVSDFAVVVLIDADRRRVEVIIGEPGDDTMPTPPPRRWLAGRDA
jgi:hypothetical protein